MANGRNGEAMFGGVAIVTGAAGGMGSQCARQLSEAGWCELILCDLSEDRLEPVAAPLRAAGSTVQLLAGQIADRAFHQALRDMVGTRAIGAVIHTAGVSPQMTDADAILAINLDGTVLLVETIYPSMAEGAAAVLYASMAGYLPVSPEADAAFEQPLPPGGASVLRHLMGEDPGAAYVLSKRAVRAIARREAKRFGERKARIVSLSPGLIDTPMLAGEETEYTRAMREGAALPRLGAPEELAAASVFLCSPAASFITGVDLRVDGGALAAMGL